MQRIRGAGVPLRLTVLVPFSIFLPLLLPFISLTAVTTVPIVAQGSINITSAHHLTSDYVFVSDITEAVKSRDANWCERINTTDIVRVAYEKNLTSGNVVDVYAKGDGNAYLDIYLPHKNSPILGTSQQFAATGGWGYITLQNLPSPSDIFDFRIGGPADSYVEFDYIHDAAPTQGTPVLNSTTATNFTTENITVYNQSSSGATKNIINWYRNSSSVMVLNMPFEMAGNISSAVVTNSVS